MIGVVHRQILGGIPEVFALGPLWGGLVLRGVWLSVQTGFGTTASAAAAICGARPAVLADVAAGVQMVRSDLVGAGFPDFGLMRFFVATNTGREFVVPVYATIDEGSSWVGLVVGAPGALDVTCGLVMEPERLVRPSLERGVAARVGGRNGDVLARLRNEAMGARDVGIEVESGVR